MKIAPLLSLLGLLCMMSCAAPADKTNVTGSEDSFSGINDTEAPGTPLGPSTPLGLTATAISSSVIQLAWNAPIDDVAIVGYRVFRGGSSSPIATTDSRTYSDTGLTPTTSYSYQVVSYNAAGIASSKSAAVSATTLAAATSSFTLTVTRSGSGSGTITGSGINCGTVCSISLAAGTTVQLTPAPAGGSTFIYWGGACSGIGACSFQMTENKNVTANFNIVGPPNDLVWPKATIGFQGNATVLKSDGTCHAFIPEINPVSNWSGIRTIAGGWSHTVGLKKDGTCLAVANPPEAIIATQQVSTGTSNMTNWTDIVAISAGYSHTAGLKADGTVIIAGQVVGADRVALWTGIVAIGAGDGYTVGVKADGTCVCAGNPSDGQCGVDGWRDIISVATGAYTIVGLKRDGTTVSSILASAKIRDHKGQCDVGRWSEVIDLQAMTAESGGLRRDGYIHHAGWMHWTPGKAMAWTDVSGMGIGQVSTVGIKSDGKIVGTGKYITASLLNLVKDWNMGAASEITAPRVPTGRSHLHPWPPSDWVPAPAPPDGAPICNYCAEMRSSYPPEHTQDSRLLPPLRGCATGECSVLGACESPSCNSPGPRFALGDTHQRTCYNQNSSITCPSSGSSFFGQDAQYGADTHPSNSRLTKVGTTQPVVTDNVTGLHWQGCVAGTSGADCSSGAAEFQTWKRARYYCDSLNWGGSSDWTLPDLYELSSIVDYANRKPAIDSTIFPQTPSSYFWSISTSALDEQASWFVNFGYGATGVGLKSAGGFTRCVRARPAYVGTRFTRTEPVAGEPIARDQNAALEWQVCNAGQTGPTCSAGSLVTYNWQAALAYCENLSWGGRNDWRLPNIVELTSLLELTKSAPSLDAIFPKPPSNSYYWSSTSSTTNRTNAWVVLYESGAYGNPSNDKTESHLVRCVR